MPKILVAVKGGPGSGNWGHAGRPGLVGGSGGQSAATHPGLVIEDEPWVIGFDYDKTQPVVDRDAVKAYVSETYPGTVVEGYGTRFAMYHPDTMWLVTVQYDSFNAMREGMMDKTGTLNRVWRQDTTAGTTYFKTLRQAIDATGKIMR